MGISPEITVFLTICSSFKRAMDDDPSGAAGGAHDLPAITGKARLESPTNTNMLRIFSRVFIHLPSERLCCVAHDVCSTENFPIFFDPAKSDKKKYPNFSVFGSDGQLIRRCIM